MESNPANETMEKKENIQQDNRKEVVHGDDGVPHKEEGQRSNNSGRRRRKLPCTLSHLVKAESSMSQSNFFIRFVYDSLGTWTFTKFRRLYFIVMVPST